MVLPIFFTSDEQEFIAKEYLAGTTQDALAAHFKVCRAPIRRALKLLHIELRPKQFTKYDIDTQQVIALYQSGYSQGDIRKQLGVPLHVIWRILHKAKIPARPFFTPKKHSLRHDAFSTLTEESAYWTGFLMADGYVYDKHSKNQIRLSLKRSDEQHIEKFKRWLGATQPITYPKDGTEVAIALSSRQMVLDLAIYGVLSCKSFTARASNKIALNRHFWRGVIDGDGCLQIRENPPTLVLSLIGSKALVMQFREFAYCNNINFRSKMRKHSRCDMYLTNFGSHNAADLAALLYDDAHIYLDRKYEKAVIFKQFSTKRGRKVFISTP